MPNSVICKQKNLLFFFRCFFVLLRLVHIALTVFLLEAFDSACRIDEFMFAGIERMAHRAYFSVDFLYGAAGLEGISAAAFDLYDLIFRMYVLFHFFHLKI